MALFPLPGLLNPAQESASGAVSAPPGGASGPAEGQGEPFSQVLNQVSDGARSASDPAQGTASEQTLPMEAENLSAAEAVASPALNTTASETAAMDGAAEPLSSMLLFLAYLSVPADGGGKAAQLQPSIKENGEKLSNLAANTPAEAVQPSPGPGPSKEAEPAAAQDALGPGEGQAPSAMSFVFSFLAILFHLAGADDGGTAADSNIDAQGTDAEAGGTTGTAPVSTSSADGAGSQPLASPGWAPSALLTQDDGWSAWMYTARFSMDSSGHVTGEAQRAAAFYSPPSIANTGSSDPVSIEHGLEGLGGTGAQTRSGQFPMEDGEAAEPRQLQGSGMAGSGGKLDIYVDRASFSGDRTSLLHLLRGDARQESATDTAPHPSLPKDGVAGQDAGLFPGTTKGRASGEGSPAQPLVSFLHEEFHFELDDNEGLKPVGKEAEVAGDGAKNGAISTAHGSGAAESSKGVLQAGRAAQPPVIDAGQRADIIKQIESGLLQSLRLREHKAMLQLHPPELGRLHVELSVNSNHQVHAQFMAEHPEVKQIIEGQIQLLKDHLAQNGFTLADVNVDVSDQQFQGQFQEQPKPSPGDFGLATDKDHGSVTATAAEQMLGSTARAISSVANGLDLTV